MFNRFEYIYDLLKKLDIQEGVSLEIFIVDHGTKDILIERSAYHIPIFILKRSPNLWFTGAVNQGIREAIKDNSFNYLSIMNDDVDIEDSRFFINLLSYFNYFDNAIIAASCIDFYGFIEYAGITYHKIKCVHTYHHRGYNKSHLNQNKKKYFVCDVLPTRTIVLPASGIYDFGFLDERNFPQYGSDYEWTARAKRQGYRLIMARDIFIRSNRFEKSLRFGMRKYDSTKIKSFIMDFFDVYSCGNYFQIKNYGKLCFSNKIEGYYYILCNICRRLLGFFYANCLKK